MTEIVVQRVEESKYRLLVDGSEVQTYQQTKMRHPWDWSEDAKAAGAAERDIRSRNYEYQDKREV